MKVDIVIATYNRADTLRETLQNVLTKAIGFNKLYVIDNASSDHTRAVIESFSDGRLVVVFAERNLGAAGGKNVGLRMSSADVIVVIDDDAIFDSEDPISRICDTFHADARIGVIQFKIVNYQTRRVLRYEFPGNDPQTDQNTSFEIAYFIGAGHAIRKLMLERVGYYPDDFGLYAHEEIDLSYRAVNAGYVMRYEPTVVVLHKKDPGGRLPGRGVLHQLLLNRLLMTRRYLPLPYSVVNNLLWICKTLFDSKSPGLIVDVLAEYVRRRQTTEKTLLTADALRYMRVNNGRLFR